MITPILLLDVTTDEPVDAELWHQIMPKNLDDWRDAWKPEIDAQRDALRAANVAPHRWPESFHWDWNEKIGRIEGHLDAVSFAIVADRMTEAMMIADLSKRSRIEGRRTDHIVYLDYLEVAPWNRRETTGSRPRLKGGGSILIRAAIELSKLEGFAGRIGLHSLPQSNSFYAEVCGTTDCGADPAYPQKLRYFEMTAEQAQHFIERDRG